MEKSDEDKCYWVKPLSKYSLNHWINQLSVHVVDEKSIYSLLLFFFLEKFLFLLFASHKKKWRELSAIYSRQVQFKTLFSPHLETV